MIRIYIVSLLKDVLKRQAIREKLNELKLDFEFIDAVYGKELPIHLIKNLRSKSNGKILKRGFDAGYGEIGCSLSHKKIYEKVIENQIEWACILEDDVILDERFAEFIQTFNDKCVDTNNLYLLGGQEGLPQNNVIYSKKNRKKIGGQQFLKSLKSEKYIYRTCCYLISYDMAKNILELLEEQFILADDWRYLVNKNIIRNIYVSDFVAHPIDLKDSAIEKERLYYNNIDIQSKKTKDYLYLIYLKIRKFIIRVYAFVEPYEKK